MTGRYLSLEPLDAARHGDALWDAVGGRETLWTWMADGPYAERAAFDEALLHKQVSTDKRFFAILNPHAAGYAALMREDAPNRTIEVGSITFGPSLQRTRAATEAMYLLARYVFEEIRYRRYEWKCNARNLPSRAAAQRLGFTFEGIFRQHMMVKGENRDTAWFSMLDSEWPARKCAFERWLDPANFDNQGRQKSKLNQ